MTNSRIGTTPEDITRQHTITITEHPPLTSSERSATYLHPPLSSSGRCWKMLLNFLAAILLLTSIAIIVFYLYKIDTKLGMLEEKNKNISSRLDLVPSGEDYEGEYLIAYCNSYNYSQVSNSCGETFIFFLKTPCLLKNKYYLHK